jgi:hypothetical protein
VHVKNSIHYNNTVLIAFAKLLSILDDKYLI